MSISAASCQAVGVYRCHFTSDEVKALADQAFGVSPGGVDAVWEQLAGLVVIEILVAIGVGKVDVGELSQAMPEEFQANTQVPYAETYWSANGTAPVDEQEISDDSPYRIVFFLHEFDITRPLFTRTGAPIPLPHETTLPERLCQRTRYEWP